MISADFDEEVCQLGRMFVILTSVVRTSCDGYVVVQFDRWFNFDFPLFFSMLIYDNEYKTKENPN